MKDIDLLERLYQMQAMDVSKVQVYLASFIDEVKANIATENDKTIGKMPAGPVFKKWMTQNKRRKLPSKMLACSKKEHFVFQGGGPAFTIHARTSLSLPVDKTMTDRADHLLDVVESNAKRCTTMVCLPSAPYLVSQINVAKALPKDKRPKIITYDFGNGFPAFDAELLLGMMRVMPGSVAWINADNGELSNLYMKYTNLDGILLPVIK